MLAWLAENYIYIAAALICLAVLAIGLRFGDVQRFRFRRVRAIEGRKRDALRLRDRLGREVALHPSPVLGGLLGLPRVQEVRVVQEVDRIEVSVVAAGDGADGPTAAVRGWFEALARERGLRLPPVLVRAVPRLGGTEATMGKFRPVECRLPPA